MDIRCKKCNFVKDSKKCKNCRNNQEYWDNTEATIDTCAICTVKKPLSTIGCCYDCLKKELMKECSKCFAVKPVGEFYSKQGTCKQCQSKIRHSSLKKYGLRTEQYDSMQKKQDEKCAICFMAKPLVVDHCHKTGKVRGLLCHTCNLGLGGFYDNPKIMESAITYLGGQIDQNKLLNHLSEQERVLLEKINKMYLEYGAVSRGQAGVYFKIIKQKNENLETRSRELEIETQDLELKMARIKLELKHILEIVYKKVQKEGFNEIYGISKDLEDELFKEQFPIP